MDIVFDFGAVLFRWDPLALVSDFFPQQCATPDAGHALARGIFYHRDWLEFDAGRMELEEVKQRTVQRLGLPADSVHALMDHQGERLAPIGESIALLQRLRMLRDGSQGEGLRLFYLSNMPEPYARVLEQRHDFIGWFDGGVFSGDVKMLKPEPGIYAHTQERLGLRPEKTIFIDDSLANAQAASAQGWRGLHLPRPELLTSLIENEISQEPKWAGAFQLQNL
jgi:putative hydrolase of the HAD superfamily